MHHDNFFQKPFHSKIKLVVALKIPRKDEFLRPTSLSESHLSLGDLHTTVAEYFRCLLFSFASWWSLSKLATRGPLFANTTSIPFRRVVSQKESPVVQMEIAILNSLESLSNKIWMPLCFNRSNWSFGKAISSESTKNRLAKSTTCFPKINQQK